MIFNVRCFALLLVAANTITAQNAPNYTQTLKGIVLDKAIKTPLTGATVALVSTTPQRGSVSDLDGHFRLGPVPVGKHSLRIT